MSDPTCIELFFDIGSPYSYLAATQMAGLTDRTGAAVHWRPFLLGAVFKATGNEAPARVPARARYMLSDLHRWAARYQVLFAFPPAFPLNTLSTQRALTAVALRTPASVAPFALALFRAYWAEGRDASSGETIAAVAYECDLDGQAIVQACGEQPIKNELRRVTDEAVARGAFGAPTLFIGEQMYFGNDRLGLLEQALTAGPASAGSEADS